MNERIHELAREAGLLVYNPNKVPTKLEKFAKLIVLECAKVCDEMDIEYGGEDVLATWCAERIKKHFGVE